MASSASSSEGDITRTTLGRVAASFVSSFYNKLHDAPNTLYKFYKSDSTLTRCNNSKLDIETLRGHEVHFASHSSVLPAPSAHDPNSLISWCPSLALSSWQHLQFDPASHASFFAAVCVSALLLRCL